MIIPVNLPVSLPAILSVGLATLTFLIVSPAYAEGPGPGTAGSGIGGGIGEKYQKRKAERFDLFSYLLNQKRVLAAQDAQYGRGGGIKGIPLFTDIALTYSKQESDIRRQDSLLGTAGGFLARGQFLVNGAISQGGQTKLINIDLGIEGFYSATDKFVATSGVTQNPWTNKEYGGALLIRPFGRSSQDTGLLLKGGYLRLQETSHWTSGVQTEMLSSAYAGAEAKLYLLGFLGAHAEYQTTFSTHSETLGGGWNYTRVKYGAFLEILLLSVEAYVQTTTYQLKTDTNLSYKDQSQDVGFSATLFF